MKASNYYIIPLSELGTKIKSSKLALKFGEVQKVIDEEGNLETVAEPTFGEWIQNGERIGKISTSPILKAVDGVQFRAIPLDVCNVTERSDMELDGVGLFAPNFLIASRDNMINGITEGNHKFKWNDSAES